MMDDNLPFISTHSNYNSSNNDCNLAEISFETLHSLGLQAWDSVIVNYHGYDSYQQPKSLDTTTTMTTTTNNKQQNKQTDISTRAATFGATSTTILRLVPCETCQENVLRIHPLLYECLSHTSQSMLSLQQQQLHQQRDENDKQNGVSATTTETGKTDIATTSSSNSLLLAIAPWLSSFPYYYDGLADILQKEESMEKVEFAWKVQPLTTLFSASATSSISCTTTTTNKIETISSLIVKCLVPSPLLESSFNSSKNNDVYDTAPPPTGSTMLLLNDWITTALKGQFIVQSGCVCILSSNNNLKYDNGENDILLLIIPNSDANNATDNPKEQQEWKEDTNNDNETVLSSSLCVYQIDTQNCSITLDVNDVVGTRLDDNNDEKHSMVGTDNTHDNEVSLERHQQLSYYDCPGYEELLNELISLFQFQGTAAPSGILLSGCPGVGKSRMASCVATAIQQQQHRQKQGLSSPSTILSQTISVQDILLHASYSTESELVDLILPPEWLRYQNDHQEQPNVLKNQNKAPRFLLIIDDLQILLQGEGNEESAYYDPEILQTKNAILQAMDKLIQMTTTTMQLQQQCSILGICQNSIPLSKEFTCVGRLEKEVTMSPPTQWQRELILKELLQKQSQQQHNHDLRDIDKTAISTTGIETITAKIPDRWISALIPMTSGCVAGDLRRLCADAWTHRWATSMTKNSTTIDDSEQLLVDNNIIATEDPTNHTLLGSSVESSHSGTTTSDISLSWEDLRDAAQRCVPSQLSKLDVIKAQVWPKECYAITNNGSVADYHKGHDWSWRSFGGYQQVKKRLYRTVVAPWRHYIMNSQAPDDPSKNKKRISTMDGISPPSGVLFHGPPGVGKTFAASCLASSLGLPVVKVRASDILDQWLGGSEAALRSLFSRARAASPCILFFDEIDAIATNRESSDDSGTDVASRLLSTFLNEMDGISGGAGGGSNNTGGGVLVVAATNRMEALDAALIRPGRLEEHILIPLPSASDIVYILGIHLEHVKVDNDVNLDDIAHKLAELRVSGADIEGFCRGLCLDILRHSMADEKPSSLSITEEQFNSAMKITLRHFCNS